jgi:hypothetical protein
MKVVRDRKPDNESAVFVGQVNQNNNKTPRHNDLHAANIHADDDQQV